MTYIHLSDIHLHMPIYDANSMRLFRRGMLGKRGAVGSSGFESRGTLQVKALNGLTLHVKEGERLALIGHNGAGKTTLLRFMAGIYPSLSGIRDVKGKVSIFGGTTTINPDATGYENIRLAMRLAGRPLSQMEHYCKDVEEFSELGEYLNMPTRIYSAGMLARLSFAITTLNTTDILLIDEGVGAGDATFASKMEARLANVAEKAKIIVFASHSNALLKQVCTTGVVLKAGQALFHGPLNEALEYYKDSITPPKREVA